MANFEGFFFSYFLCEQRIVKHWLSCFCGWSIVLKCSALLCVWFLSPSSSFRSTSGFISKSVWSGKFYSCQVTRERPIRSGDKRIRSSSSWLQRPFCFQCDWVTDKRIRIATAAGFLIHAPSIFNCASVKNVSTLSNATGDWFQLSATNVCTFMQPARELCFHEEKTISGLQVASETLRSKICSAWWNRTCTPRWWLACTASEISLWPRPWPTGGCFIFCTSMCVHLQTGRPKFLE